MKMKSKTKWKLAKFLYIAGLVLVFLLFFPLYAFFLPVIFRNMDFNIINIIRYIHYGALAAVAFTVIMLGPIDKPKDDNENEEKPNIIKNVFRSPSALISLIAALAVSFSIGFGVSSCVHNGSFLHQTGFIANTNTNKIHDTNCKHIKSISKENRLYFVTYEEAKDYKAFMPCQDCMPDAYWEYISAREIAKEAKSDELDYYTYKDYAALQDEYDELYDDYNELYTQALILDHNIDIACSRMDISRDEFDEICLEIELEELAQYENNTSTYKERMQAYYKDKG